MAPVGTTVPYGSSSAERARRAVLLVVAVGVAGRTMVRPVPDLGGIYDRAAQVDDTVRNPVIVIPGVLGSKLRDRESRRVVWGAFAGLYANPRRPDGARGAALSRRGTAASRFRQVCGAARVVPSPASRERPPAHEEERR